jgi:hypothetical protein
VEIGRLWQAEAVWWSNQLLFPTTNKEGEAVKAEVGKSYCVVLHGTNEQLTPTRGFIRLVCVLVDCLGNTV